MIFSILMPYLGLMFAFAILIGVIGFFKPLIKGKIGEWNVKQQISHYLGERYIDLHDLTFQDERGTTQIDHIVISPYGLFVIETKNYTGWIFASEHQKTWTQKIYKKNFKFQNSIHQNYRHVKVIEKILDQVIEFETLHSFVIFQNGCEFKTTVPTNVFVGKSWINYIKTFDQVVFSDIAIKNIRLQLEKASLHKSFKMNQKHIKNLRDQHADKS